jgi:lysophospholipase L1-like esterase
MLRRWLKILTVQCAIVVLLLEIALRVHNPLTTTVRGDTIVLPVNQQFTIENPSEPGLDRVVVQTRNGLGLRGPDVPANFASRLSIVAVGGSTTECAQLADDRTWPAVMAADLAATRPDVWVNNAGLAGHSTFGHLVLLRAQLAKLHPKVALFLAGINDVGMGEQEPPDATPRRRWRALTTHSELAHTVLTLARAWLGREMRYDLDGSFTLSGMPHRTMSDAEMAAVIANHAAALDAYRARLVAIVTEARRQKIVPVLATQPLLFGPAIDPATGINLATVVSDRWWISLRGEGNGLLAWRVL